MSRKLRKTGCILTSDFRLDIPVPIVGFRCWWIRWDRAREMELLHGRPERSVFSFSLPPFSSLLDSTNLSFMHNPPQSSWNWLCLDRVSFLGASDEAAFFVGVSWLRDRLLKASFWLIHRFFQIKIHWKISVIGKTYLAAIILIAYSKK